MPNPSSELNSQLSVTTLGGKNTSHTTEDKLRLINIRITAVSINEQAKWPVMK